MSHYAINLLTKKKNKVADKLLYFVLYYFRYIIIITQIVVIGVFFFRFREDQKIIDLKQKFRQKQQILAVTSPLVDEAQAIEKKAGYIKGVLSTQDAFLLKYKTVLSLIPADVTLQSIEIGVDSVHLEGTSPNVDSIRSLHRKMQLTPMFENAQIGTINGVSTGGFEFIIEVLPSSTKKKPA